MAWRPYENLIHGELDNRTPGKVTGWMRFFRRGTKPLKVLFDLEGDFHEDIRGKVIRLHNPRPADRNEALDREGTYMGSFAPLQRGTVGDITAGRSLGPWTEALSQKLLAQQELWWDERGLPAQERDVRRQDIVERHRQHIEAGELYYPYVAYPYIEWYAANGRVVLELDPSQVEVLDSSGVVPREKTPKEAMETERKRIEAFGAFMAGMVRSLSEENRKKGGDGNVGGIIVG